MFASFLNFSKNRSRKNGGVRDGSAQYIDISENETSDDAITDHERLLLSNILKLRNEPVVDVMVPRAEIIAVDVETSCEDLLQLLADKQVSRLPVYEDNLDNVLGSLHIKEILSALAAGNGLNIRDYLTDIPIISPAMPILDLILEMRSSRRHMALVVDEHGGIDGLVTLNDIVESIVGEIDDEHDNEDDEPQMTREDDGSVVADGRLDIEEFEEVYGCLLSEEEREEIETLGGLVFTMAGRIPSRGEVLNHKSGMVFEILEADPRRVYKMRIRDIPARLG